MAKVLVVGAAFVDVMMNVERLPKSGMDITGWDEEIIVGGCALNVANVLSQENVDFTLIAPVGKGKNGQIIRKAMNDMNIPIMVETQEDNGYCLALVEKSGERTFITLNGVEQNFEPEWFTGIDPNNYSLGYASGYEIEGNGGDTIINFFEENPQITLFYGPGPRIGHIDKEKHERILAMNPILHLNESEIEEFMGEKDVELAAKELNKITNNTVIVTLGEEGSMVIENGQITKVEGKKVQVVDTSGAGDSHIGGVLASRYFGKTFKEALAVANEIGAKVVSSRGPRYIKL